jgi:hypothetical protein
MRLVVILLAVAGCARNPAPAGAPDLARSGGGSGGSGGGGGGAVHDMALATGDMVHPLTGISCGNMQCIATAQYCCTGDKGVTGTCYASNQFSCAQTYFFCDGPEDCPPALPECCITNGAANCVGTGECAANMGSLMCHVAADCSGANCCNAKGSPYSLCLTQPCP